MKSLTINLMLATAALMVASTTASAQTLKAKLNAKSGGTEGRRNLRRQDS